MCFQFFVKIFKPVHQTSPAPAPFVIKQVNRKKLQLILLIWSSLLEGVENTILYKDMSVRRGGSTQIRKLK